MSNDIKIKKALVSVFYKTGLDKIVNKLSELGVEIYSTGGTKTFIENLGVSVKSVESLTGYPSILGGRVKTLHPKVFGGILARRDNQQDNKEVEQYEIPLLDLVIVDLYPFEQTVASGAPEQDIIEKIDIGGISLIRAAAKNFKDTVIIPSVAQYQQLLDILENQNGVTTLEQRKDFAKKAFGVSSYYDSKIYSYFAQSDPETAELRVAETTNQEMRYGENPHQKAKFFGNINDLFDKLHGKDLSYNNMLDVDAAVNLIDEFDETTFVINGEKVSGEYVIGKTDSTKAYHKIGIYLGILLSKWGFMFLVIFPTLFAIMYEIAMIIELSKDKSDIEGDSETETESES